MEGSSRRDRDRIAAEEAALAELEAEKERRIPPEVMRELTECFALFDENDTGMLDIKHLNLALKGLGVFLTETEMTNTIEDLDPKETGFIKFLDFATLALEKLNEQDDQTQLKQCFTIFDRDDEGFLPMDRFKKLMMTLGDVMTEQEATECGKLGDIQQKGMVIYGDLVAILCAK